MFFKSLGYAMTMTICLSLPLVSLGQNAPNEAPFKIHHLDHAVASTQSFHFHGLRSAAAIQKDYQEWLKRCSNTLQLSVFTNPVTDSNNLSVVCDLSYDRSGKISAVKVTRSSGNRSFDDQLVARIFTTKLDSPPEFTSRTSFPAEFKSPYVKIDPQLLSHDP